MTALITTAELASRLGELHLRVIDASWYMPAENRMAKEEFIQAHIPSAMFFDIDAVCDCSSPYPHMLPDERLFTDAMSRLGINTNDAIVVYDGSGVFSAPRLWWMLRVFGHENVRVLDGGMPQWKSEGRAVQAGMPGIIPGIFVARMHPQLLRSLKAMQDNITSNHECVVDARSPGRFYGKEPEPRPGLRSGNIPGSINVYFKDCLDPPCNTLKSKDALCTLFDARGVDISRPIVASCGSGVTACVLALALYELGNKEVAIYDGAWAEWGSQQLKHS